MYADIDWVSMSGAERLEPTKALYRAFITVAEHNGINADLMLDRALGEAQERGIDYASNFRAGKISKVRAKAIHLWLAQNYFEMAKATAPDLFPYRPVSAFQHFIDKEAIVGKLRVIKISKTLGLIERSDEKRKHVQTLRLSEKFCFEIDTEITGVALAFQCYQDVWHPLPIGADKKRLKADITAGTVFLPKAVDGKSIPLEENNDAGNHQFTIIVSENRNLPQSADELVKAIRLDHPYEVYIVDVRFVTCASWSYCAVRIYEENYE